MADGASPAAGGAAAGGAAAGGTTGGRPSEAEGEVRKEARDIRSAGPVGVGGASMPLGWEDKDGGISPPGGVPEAAETEGGAAVEGAAV